jgi:serine/threonine-protein kinase
MEHSKANAPTQSEQTITIGRYVLHREIARGGMATIHFGRLLGDEGFSRIVAIKRLHAELAQDEQFVAMFLDEARIASRVQHRNVVPVLDVAAVSHEVILVQEYVQGVPLDLLLAEMRRSQQRLPIDVAVAIACQVLAGIQATHETVDELGQPMHIVHRDVSPQNVMIALDGSARLLDFGIATAGAAPQGTNERMYKGKLAYSAPEQLQWAATPQSDIYSASVLLWELLVGQRMHGEKRGAELVSVVLRGALPEMQKTLAAAGRWDALNEADRAQREALEPIVKKGLCLDTAQRWARARDMEEALAARVRPAPARVLAEWVRTAGEAFLARRARILAIEEERWRRLHPLDNARTTDPGSQGLARNMRISSPPESPAPAKRSAGKRVRAGHVAIAIGCSVAVASALALLLPASPASRSEVEPLAEAPRPTRERPAASQAPTLQAVPEPRAVAPLALPTLQTASQARPVGPQPVDRAVPMRRVSTLPQTTDIAESRTPPVLRSTPAQVKDGIVPAAGRTAESDDCEVPYYFEGKKKIFKSACL